MAMTVANTIVQVEFASYVIVNVNLLANNNNNNADDYDNYDINDDSKIPPTIATATATAFATTIAIVKTKSFELILFPPSKMFRLLHSQIELTFVGLL